VAFIERPRVVQQGDVEMASSFSRLDDSVQHESLPVTDISEVGSVNLLARLRNQNSALEKLRNALDFEDDVARPAQRDPMPA
jgi:hypothetical protein